MGYLYIVGGHVQGSATMGRFQDLVDAPSLTGNAGKFLKLDGGATKLEFADVVFGDIEFKETTCRNCGEPLLVGQKVVLQVTKWVAGEKVSLVPVHHNCMGKGG